MARNDRFRGRYIHPEDFRDLRRSADLTRKARNPDNASEVTIEARHEARPGRVNRRAA
jgi:hypothetical protein